MNQKGMSLFAVILMLVGSLFSTSIAASETLKDAETVLQELKSKSNSEPAETENPGEKASFKKDLMTYNNNRRAMSPMESASAWLDLWDRYWSTFSPEEILLSRYSEFDGNIKNTPIAELIIALPPPDTWSILKNMIEKRAPETRTSDINEKSLRLLFCMLNADAAGMDKELKGIEKWMNKSGSGAFGMNETEALMKFKASLEGKDPGVETVRAFEELVQKLEKGELRSNRVRVPDLVLLVGKKRASRLIARLLLIKGIELNAPSDTDTARLIREVALDHVEELPGAQWSLVNSLDAVELYEGLEKRFGKDDQEKPATLSTKMRQFGVYDGSNRDGNARKTATVYYILGLVARGETDKAMTIAGTLNIRPDRLHTGYGAWEKAQGRISPSVLFTFLDHLLSQHPEIPWWNFYMTLGLQTEKSDIVIGHLRTALQGKDLEPGIASLARETLYKGLLAVGNVDEAIALLRKKAVNTVKKQPDGPKGVSIRFHAASTMMEIGRLINNEKLVDEGLSLSMKIVSESMEGNNSNSYSRFYGMNSLVERLLKMNRLEEAEGLLVSALKTSVQAPGEISTRRWQSSRGLSEILTLLAKIYRQADRPADVMVLLDKYPWWGVKDIKDISDPELWVTTSWALHKTGDDESAVKILKACIFKWQGYDPAFSLLCDIAGQDAIAWFDLLYARDHFEERPLIWKAELLRRAGDLDNADTVIHQALKVDPTDGEQPAGSRVRAYAVLADILEAKGNRKDADFFRNVVKSVRVAEHGDELREAGLMSMSLKSYWEAERFFADAYCVQWRLAERLRAKGQLEEASKHYEIVFKRMPEQFGRLARLCFGCENIFGNQPSRSAAEKVLTGLLDSREKNRPQVYFLMGQLREAQNKDQEAYAYFRKAVDIDPDYINAWQQIRNLQEELIMKPKEAQAVSLRLLELDPLQRHIGTNYAKIYDLKLLWKVLAGYQSYNLEKPESLYVLKASSAELDAFREKAMAAGMGEMADYGIYKSYSEWPAVPKPGKVLASYGAVREVLGLLRHGERIKMRHNY